MRRVWCGVSVPVAEVVRVFPQLEHARAAGGRVERAHGARDLLRHRRRHGVRVRVRVPRRPHPRRQALRPCAPSTTSF